MTTNIEEAPAWQLHLTCVVDGEAKGQQVPQVSVLAGQGLRGENLAAGAVVAHELGQGLVADGCLFDVFGSLGSLLAAVHKDEDLQKQGGRRNRGVMTLIRSRCTNAGGNLTWQCEPPL